MSVANIENLKRANSVLVVPCSNDHKAQDAMIRAFEKLEIAYEVAYLCRVI